MEPPAHFDRAVRQLGLERALGSLRLLQAASPSALASENVNTANLPPQSHAQAAQPESGAADKGGWVPLQLQLGLPLAPAELCDRVCRSGMLRNAAILHHALLLLARLDACVCHSASRAAPQRESSAAAAVCIATPVHCNSPAMYLQKVAWPEVEQDYS